MPAYAKPRDPLIIGLLATITVLIGIGVYLLAVKPDMERKSEIATLKSRIESLEKDIPVARDEWAKAVMDQKPESVKQAQQAGQKLEDMEKELPRLRQRLEELEPTSH